MRWLYKLENKLGQYYIRGLMTVVVAGMVLVYLADMFVSAGGFSVSAYLGLDTAAVLHGQIWRLVTFIFVPPQSTNPFLLLINLYFYYMMGRLLEGYWGGFRLNVYYLFGMVGAILGAYAAHLLLPVLFPDLALLMGTTGVGVTGGNDYLNLSLFLAFAAIAPDMEFRLFFLIPIKAKWMALAYAVLLIIPLLQSFLFRGIQYGVLQLVQLVFSLVNYLIFFGPTLLSGVRQQMLIARNRRKWRDRNK